MNVMHKFGIFGACFEPILVLIRSTKGDIHKLRRQARGKGEGRGGFAKCQCYYISLCSKLASGGEGGQNWQNLAYVVYGSPLNHIYVRTNIKNLQNLNEHIDENYS